MSALLIEVLAGVLVAIFGSGGLVWTLLHYNRDEAARVIAQHSELLDDMRSLYETMKTERDELHEEVINLRKEVAALKDTLRSYTDG